MVERQETILAVALGVAGLVVTLLTLLNLDTLSFVFEEWSRERAQAPIVGLVRD